MDLELLSYKHVAPMILKIRDNPDATKTELMTDENRKGSDRMRFLSIQRLIDEGIAEINTESRGHNTMRVHLTSRGLAIAALLDAIQRL